MQNTVAITNEDGSSEKVRNKSKYIKRYDWIKQAMKTLMLYQMHPLQLNVVIMINRVKVHQYEFDSDFYIIECLLLTFNYILYKKAK